MSRSLRELYESSPFSSAQAPYVEEQYERFLADPVERQRRNGAISSARSGRRAPAAGAGAASPAPKPAQPSTAAPAHPTPTTDVEKQSSVSRLIQFYANRGHLIADIDPLGLMQRPMPRVLDPAYVGLTEADMDTVFHTASRTSGVDKQMKLSEILKQLRHIYTGRIGAEFAHVSTSEERLWLQDRFQDGHASSPLHQRRTPEPALAAHRGRGARALPAHALRRPEAILARGRRRADRAARRRRATQRGEQRRGNRDRHGPPRPAQRAGQRARQVAVDAVLRIRGQARGEARTAARAT